MSSQDELKRRAAERAIELIEPGMKLGLGTGSTTAYFIELLGMRASKGLDVVGVPTSDRTRRQCEAVGIPLTTLDTEPYLDLTVDGADELDGELRLIKGGGGALLREKIVATASERMVVLADASKQVETLGAFPLPVEVIEFGLGATCAILETLAGDAGCTGELTVRKGADGQPFRTDSGNLIVDCAFKKIEEPELLAEALQMIPGVVEHGLFLGIADVAIVAQQTGTTIVEAPDVE
ncbi:MAG: ribose-5-phosphate isomerase RpiA [Pseudomonadota bacterium]